MLFDAHTPTHFIEAVSVTISYNKNDAKFYVLLAERNILGHDNYWMLPGDFIGEEESAEDCIKRVHGDMRPLELESTRQFETFSEVDRCPQCRLISVVYISIASSADVFLCDNSIHDAKLVAEDKLYEEEIYADYRQIIIGALEKVKSDIINDVNKSAFELMGEKFTLSDLQRLYEKVLGKRLDVSNFYKRVKNNIEEIPEDRKRDTGHRPNKYYRYTAGSTLNRKYRRDKSDSLDRRYSINMMGLGDQGHLYTKIVKDDLSGETLKYEIRFYNGGFICNRVIGWEPVSGIFEVNPDLSLREVAPYSGDRRMLPLVESVLEYVRQEQDSYGIVDYNDINGIINYLKMYK